MPALQLRGFFISLLGMIALLLTLATATSVANAQGEKSAIAPSPVAQPRVAVLYFDYSGNDEEMAFLRKGMTQMLVTDLSAMGDLQIVERIDLEAVLTELKLGRTGKVDPTTRNTIGKLLGARYLVTGGYFQFKNTLRVDAKIINVERGTTVSFSAQAAPSDFMKIEAELTEKLHAGLLKLNATKANAKRVKARKTAKRRSKRAARVSAKTVARYGRALDALDQGKKEVAASELKAVTREAPHFKPAVDDLRILLR